MKIALDAMGGDHAPEAPVEAARLFARELHQHEVWLVGDEARLRPILTRLGSPPNVQIRHAPGVLTHEDAAASIRQRPDASLRVCFDLLRDNQVNALVSAGHSGAMMAGALFFLGRIEGLERPAFAALLPALGGRRWLLLDAGANVQCRPSHLVQFALMGEAYVKSFLSVERPRVAVLSNGEEDSKGTDLTREALESLRKTNLNVVGYVEGKDLFFGHADVVVTDGFTGNVVLKTSEGTATGLIELIREHLQRAPLLARLGSRLVRPVLRRVRQVVDYAEYGGAPLLGVEGVAVVAHGRSTPLALKNALRAALQLAEGRFVEQLKGRLEMGKRWSGAA